MNRQEEKEGREEKKRLVAHLFDETLKLTQLAAAALRQHGASSQMLRCRGKMINTRRERIGLFRLIHLQFYYVENKGHILFKHGLELLLKQLFNVSWCHLNS